jgi:acetyltransferase-like isoleucine patch superfamily enzyme
MNVLSKVFQFLIYGNKVHPISTVRGPLKNFYLRNSTVKLLCELIAMDGIIRLESVWIDRFARILSTKLVEIESGTTINMNTKIYGEVKIGKSCLIAPNVFISSHTHIFQHYPNLTIREQEQRYIEEFGEVLSEKIEIGSNVWIGANCVILPGVSICSNAVIAANSVVNGNIKIAGVYAGSPAKLVKAL